MICLCLLDLGSMIPLVLILQTCEDFCMDDRRAVLQEPPIPYYSGIAPSYSSSRSHLHYFRRENREDEFLWKTTTLAIWFIEFIPIRLFYYDKFWWSVAKIGIQFIYKSFSEASFKVRLFNIFHIKRFIFRCKIKLLFQNLETFWVYISIKKKKEQLLETFTNFAKK